ncbi:carbohydrate ABC transporter membrane protein 1, CUT1 family [Clostridium amylolyticum]|uniref:Carbohydrate ABC transporter membrane protein 1, CUT1 family n=1 Tax=Clostridium amylolyticum TaxID=1121298 RepID=A0A1M6GTC3_9CLOT|nr:ABC transporter permease subunit [Clostridium amylolyticum]SHJ13213.1 carbohydrate ABC transporter membrane protein 1, CUT1 family [Clostridium amylolyticum]
MQLSRKELEVSKLSSKKKNKAWIDIKKDWDLYLLLVPGLVTLFIFKYTPMYGLIIAFQDFNIFSGITGSEWVGLANFRKLFSSPEFLNVFRNTLIISVSKIIFLFPLPIILAILLNEIKNLIFKKSVQTVIYLPHFISWVIVSGLFMNLLSVNGGIVNTIISKFGGQPIAFFMEPSKFRPLLVITEGWKEVGWGTIVYLAAITGIEQEQYEAAKIDGANKLQQILSITIPGIAPTIVLMFILRLGSVLEAGTEQIMVMYNAVVYNVSDVIGTYVFRVGLGTSDYSFSTAVGLFNSVVSFMLVVGGNYLCKKFLDKSIW